MFRRRRYLIQPKFQLTLIAFNAILAALTIIIFYAQNIAAFTELSGADIEELQANEYIQEVIQEEETKLRRIFSLTSLVVLFLMVVGGLILSNRVAGPIYRMQTHMKDLLDGKDVGPIKFRDKDFFLELAEQYNEVLKKGNLISDKPPAEKKDEPPV